MGAFHLCLLLTLAGIIGVFTALDLFLFYFFWELMLVPMYFLIAVWGHENRVPAAIKFFVFTQGGSLLMFVAILTLYFIHGRDTGVYSFDYRQWVQMEPTGAVARWLMLGFFISFAVKLPVVGLHTWLPDAHTEAPTGGSVLLAGLLLKTGAYGLLRFAMPLFPTASNEIAWFAMILGVAGILYGAFLAFAQPDAKRLVAYTSVSHLGFVLLGIYAGTHLAPQGAMVILLAHGLSTGGLFIVVGALQERLHTRQLDELGGLWSSMPRMGGVALFLAPASLGLPGLANFVGEFLVLTAMLGCAVLVASTHFISFFVGLELLTVSLYVLIAYSRSRQTDVEAGIKYFIPAATSSAFLLFGMALLYAQMGTMALSELVGLIAAGRQQSGLLAVMLTATLFSLAGIPLTAGFLGKFYVLLAGVRSDLWLLVFVLVISSVIALFYYLRVIVALYQPVPSAPSGSLAGGIVLALLLFALIRVGVYPGPIIRFIEYTVTR